ncbi:hypothetical protein [Bifidobacterium moukalabense]|uniref:hypothetical protein n=1 Tax=Bifidobacterium moukalabense TaxID=1333651 RepID=UPI0010F5CEE6|nr:hypothetical protein [Bifidobacterium moukalabense]
MTDIPELVEVSAAGLTITFDGGHGVDPKDDVLLIAKDGIEGWYDFPDDKTVMSERGQGDGAHDVWQSDFLYSARVITLHFVVSAHDRIGIVRLLNDVRRVCAHRRVKFRLKDATHDCYVTGRAVLASNGQYGTDGWLEDNTLTVTCERPEILSTNSHDGEARAATIQSGGLSYGSGNAGLAYPLSYGVVSGGATLCRLPNDGTSRAYPTFTINGDWPSGVSLYLNCEGRRTELRYDSAIHFGTPVLLDTRTRTATLGGVDVSKHLSARGWRTIPAGKALTVLLGTAGSGWVSCSSHDTYM